MAFGGTVLRTQRLRSHKASRLLPPRLPPPSELAPSMRLSCHFLRFGGMRAWGFWGSKKVIWCYVVLCCSVLLSHSNVFYRCCFVSEIPRLVAVISYCHRNPPYADSFSLKQPLKQCYCSHKQTKLSCLLINVVFIVSFFYCPCSSLSVFFFFVFLKRLMRGCLWICSQK